MAVVATVATAAMVIVMSVLVLIFFYQKATDLSSFTKLQIWKGKELGGNLFASQNREALCSTALENMTT